MCPTTLGRLSVGDGSFVLEVLADTRSPRLNTVEKVLTWMQVKRAELVEAKRQRDEADATAAEIAAARALLKAVREARKARLAARRVRLAAPPPAPAGPARPEALSAP